MKAFAASVLCGVMLSSCALSDAFERFSRSKGWCLARNDTRHWTRLPRAPANSADLRRQADAHPIYRDWSYGREIWFRSANGAITLCRLAGNRAQQQSEWGASWEFTADGRYVERVGSGWMTVH